uniref:Uncharacterized protein n=1 Tax=Oryza nivara TaxID=4536 RepID=A0A0E0IM06_ORYNI
MPATSASVLSVAVSTFADFEPVFFSNVEPHPHAVKVLAVRELKHAPALLHLLESASSDHGCKIVGLRLVENLSKLDALLAVVSEGVIPLLLNDLRDPDANRELRRCAQSIHRVGRLIGGYARRKSKALALVLRRHVSHVFKGTRGDGCLLKNLQATVPSRIATMRTHRIDLARAPPPDHLARSRRGR